ncbi:MAG: antibiotic biosynthesis monooxygenase family protein [Flavobacteriaceae bacterium]|nr:antibiotic biosynthesis monooxygenase family protein [Flavobacteriaceae bacterium]
MITRVVKMHFRKEAVSDFLLHFDKHKNAIRQQPGCQLLVLYQDVEIPEIFFTYSFWDTEKHLNLYRKTALFTEVWAYTKTLFKEKPLAWSLTEIHKLP